MMTVTQTGEMEKVRGMSVCTVLIMSKTAPRRRKQVCMEVCRYAWKIKKKKNTKELTSLQTMML